MTVVDASVLVAALVDSGQEGRWAESAVAEGHLNAPELALVEASNVLRRLERSEQISRIEATAPMTICCAWKYRCFRSRPLLSVNGRCAVAWQATTRGTLRWLRGWIARL